MAKKKKGKRYAAWVGDDEIYTEARPSISVLEEEGAADTGLVDAQGRSIWRLPRPIGFID